MNLRTRWLNWNTVSRSSLTLTRCSPADHTAASAAPPWPSSQTGSEAAASLRSLTVLRLPPLQLPPGLEGGDDVLDQVAVGVAVAVVRQPGVAGEALLLLLVEEVKPDASEQASASKRTRTPDEHIRCEPNGFCLLELEVWKGEEWRNEEVIPQVGGKWRQLMAANPDMLEKEQSRRTKGEEEEAHQSGRKREREKERAGEEGRPSSAALDQPIQVSAGEVTSDLQVSDDAVVLRSVQAAGGRS